MPLSDAAARKAKPAEKPYKLADERGLYLFVTTTGFKSWRFKYRFGDKERRLTFGGYPEVTLAEARDRRDEARRLLRDGRDPGVEREKQRVAALTEADAAFEAVARRWHADQLAGWTPRYAAIVLRALERDVFPDIGAMSVKEITAPVLLVLLRSVQRRGSLETAHRIRQKVSDVFAYAIGEGLIDANPAATVGKSLKKAPPARKFPAITDLDRLRDFLTAFEAAQDVGPVVRFASRLLALTVPRPGVLATARWEEFEGIDWDGTFVGPLLPVWRLAPDRLKLDTAKKDEASYELVIPLAWQSVELLRALRRVTGRSEYLFPSARGWRRPMSGDAIRMAYRRVGYGADHVPHGWRSSFLTIINERIRRARPRRDADRALADMMLAHVPEGMSASELRYNRMEHQADFRRIAQEWADVLLVGQKPAEQLLFV